MSRVGPGSLTHWTTGLRRPSSPQASGLWEEPATSVACSDGHDWKLSPKQLENCPKITKVEKQTALDCLGQKWIDVTSLWCVRLWVFIYFLGEEEAPAEVAYFSP